MRPLQPEDSHPTPPKGLRVPKDLPSSPSLSYRPGERDQSIRPGAQEDAREESSAPTMAVQINRASLLGESADVELNPGAFDLRRLVGVGAMGEVWEAVQHGLWRIVAVKRMRRGTEGSTIEEERMIRGTFIGEAMVAARLDHPNIIPVYELGTDEQGSPLLAMKLIRGQSWDRVLREDFEQMPMEEYLATHLPILVQVCQAVAFAHSRGIIHRDLKPSQVMLGEYGEVLLTDWGLAIMSDHAPEIEGVMVPSSLYPVKNRAHNPAGTPGYMAPEQTELTCENIGPWTDVYLLGGTLFHILTRESPHPGVTCQDVFISAASAVVKSFDEAAPGRDFPEELMRLAMDAMVASPYERLSAIEFLGRLRDYMHGASARRESEVISEEISHRPPGKSYREFTEALSLLGQARLLWPGNPVIPPLREKLVEEYARLALKRGDLTLALAESERLENPVLRKSLTSQAESDLRAQAAQRRRVRQYASLAAALLLLVAIGSVLFTIQLNQANKRVVEELAAAQHARDAEAAANVVAERESQRATVLLADALVSQERFEEAVRELLRIPEKDRFWEWGYILTRALDDLWTIPYEYLHWSPSANYALGVHRDTGFWLLQAETGEELFYIGKTAPETIVAAYSRDESALACWTAEGTIAIVDIPTGNMQVLDNSVPDTTVTALEFSPDATRLAIGNSNGGLQLLDLPSGAVTPLATHGRNIRGIYWGDRRIVSISTDMTRRHDPITGISEVLRSTGAIEGIYHPFLCLSDRERRHFAILHIHHPVLYGSIDAGAVKFVPVQAHGIAMANRSPKLLILGGYRLPQYHILDLEADELSQHRLDYAGEVYETKRSGQWGEAMFNATLSEDDTRALIHANMGDWLVRFPTLERIGSNRMELGDARRSRLHPSGHSVYKVYENKTRLVPAMSSFVGLPIPGGTASFGGNDEYTAQLTLNWLEHRDTRTGELRYVGGRNMNLFLGGRPTTDRRTIYIPGRVYDTYYVERGSLTLDAVPVRIRFDEPFGVLALHPDSALLATTGSDQTAIKSYSLEDDTATLLHHIEMPEGQLINRLAYTANAQELIAATTAGKMRVYNAATGDFHREITAHQGMVTALFYNSALEKWVTMGQDHSIRFWDGKGLTPEETLTFDFPIAGLSFSSKSELILAWPERGVPVIRRIFDGSEVVHLERSEFPMDRARFIADDSRIVASSNQAARFWDTRTGMEVFAMDRGFGEVSNNSRMFIYQHWAYEGTLMEMAPLRASADPGQSAATFSELLERWKADRFIRWSEHQVRQRVPRALESMALLEGDFQGANGPHAINHLGEMIRTYRDQWPRELLALMVDRLVHAWMTRPYGYFGVSSFGWHHLLLETVNRAPSLITDEFALVSELFVAQQLRHFMNHKAILDPFFIHDALHSLSGLSRLYEYQGDLERMRIVVTHELALRQLVGFPPGEAGEIAARHGIAHPAPPPSELCMSSVTNTPPYIRDWLDALPTEVSRESLQSTLDAAWESYLERFHEHLANNAPPLDWDKMIEDCHASPLWVPLPSGLQIRDVERELRERIEAHLFDGKDLSTAVAEERKRMEERFAPVLRNGN